MSKLARARRLLAREVWEIADIEQSASTAGGIILASGMLTDAEARFITERMLPEEREHDRNMQHWAEQLHEGPRPTRLGAHSASTRKDMLLIARLPDRERFAYILATMVWNEAFTLKWAPRTIRLYKRIDPGFGAQYAANMREEAGHVAWGQRVEARMAQADPPLYRAYTVYKDYLGAMGPAVVARAHMATYRKLEDALA